MIRNSKSYTSISYVAYISIRYKYTKSKNLIWRMNKIELLTNVFTEVDTCMLAMHLSRYCYGNVPEQLVKIL